MNNDLCIVAAPEITDVSCRAGLTELSSRKVTLEKCNEVDFKYREW